jgi:hypothetical protein
MSKIPKNFNTTILEKVYKKMITEVSYEDFLDTLIAEVKEVKKNEDALAKEEASKITIEDIYPELPKGTTHEEYIEEIVEENEWFDYFYDSNGMDDEGADHEYFIMIEDKAFQVDIHCEADWVGDWSVRKNLPGEVSIVKITELKYELISKKDNTAIIKLI